MRRIVTAILSAAALAGPSSADASPGWVPDFDEVTPSTNMRTPVAVVKPDLSTVALWVQYPGIHAAVRPRGGTFGEPFEIDAGDSSYVPQNLDAIALPDGDVLTVWSGPTTQAVFAKLLHPDGTVTTALTPDVGSSSPAVAANADGRVAVAYYYFNQVYLAIRPAGAASFDAPVLLLTLVGNEQQGSLDVTVRADGQVSVAVGTDVANPPGGAARMLILRRANGSTTTEFVDSRTLTLTPPVGQSENASYRPKLQELANGNQILVYRLETSSFGGTLARDLYGGARNGTPGAPPLVDSSNNFASEHDVVVDEAGRPFVWWRKDLGPNQGLRVARASTAGVFSTSQLLTSGSFGSAALTSFGAGRSAMVFTQSGKVQASTSEAGAAFGAPVEVVTPGTVPSTRTGLGLAGAGEGSAVALWPDGANVTASALHAKAFDATPPILSGVQVPASLTAGVSGMFSATATDDWSSPSVSWLFGDGALLPGATVQHAFSAAGALAATATATDAVGNTATASRTVNVTAAPSPAPDTSPPAGTPAEVTPLPGEPAPAAPVAPAAAADTRAPVLSGLRLVPSTLKRGKRATSMRFQLDEPATVLAQLERAQPGFRSGRRCLLTAPRPGTAKRCTRFVRSGAAVQRSAGAGAGQLTIRRPRSVGRYRVGVQAVDAAGNRSALQRRALTVR